MVTLNLEAQQRPHVLKSGSLKQTLDNLQVANGGSNLPHQMRFPKRGLYPSTQLGCETRQIEEQI